MVGVDGGCCWLLIHPLFLYPNLVRTNKIRCTSDLTGFHFWRFEPQTHWTLLEYSVIFSDKLVGQFGVELRCDSTTFFERLLFWPLNYTTTPTYTIGELRCDPWPARGCVLVCLGMATLIALVTLEVVDLSAGAGIFVSCQQAASVAMSGWLHQKPPMKHLQKTVIFCFFYWPCPYCTFIVIVLKGRKAQ